MGWGFLARLSGKPVLIGLFLLCALPGCFSMAMVTPPGQVPDEPAHMTRAAGLLHGAILGVRKPVPGGRETVGVKVDSGLFASSFGHVTMLDGRAVVTAQDYDDARNQAANHRRSFAAIPNTATYFPLAYVPAALGLAAGLVAHASPFICMMLGRLAAAVAFLALGCWALWIAAYGEALILTVLLLPMTLFLAGSLNEDGVLIGLACVSAAALTQDAAQRPKLRMVAFAALVAVLASKPPYLPMLGLGLLPLRARGIWRRTRQVLVAALPVLVWVVIIVKFIVVPFERSPYHPGPLYAGDRSVFLTATNAAANLHILLAHPSLFWSLPIGIISLAGWQLYHEMIGVLGLLALNLPARYYTAWSVALAVAIVGLAVQEREGTAARSSVFDLGAALGLLAFTGWLVIISFYLSWTTVGQPVIDGVQGRYALIILPFLVAAAPAWGVWRVPRIVPCLPALALGMYDVGYLPAKLAWFFYVH